MKTALVIGGTGTLGRAFVPHLLQVGDFDRIRVLSRGEHKQIEMQRELDGMPIDYLMGDVRDADRMFYAAKDCESVFHFAATKSVDKVEENLMEGVETNVLGTSNVVKACHLNRVSRAIFTSTDKATAPLNAYGAQKLLAEKIWLAGNCGSWGTKFSAVRYGNVWGSAGSVLQKWAQGPPYKLTDPDMTRFFMPVEQAVNLIVEGWRCMRGGEVFISKMKSCTIADLLDTVAPNAGEDDVKVIGVRPGEKMHEALFTEDEHRLVTDCGGFYIRWPSHRLFPFAKRGNKLKGFETGFTSHNAEKFTKEELKELWQSP